MKKMLLSLITAGLVLTAPAWAGEDGFETTSQGILLRLTAPPAKAGRHVKTRSLTLSTPPKTRAITVMMRDSESGRDEPKTIFVDEGKNQRNVQLRIEFDRDSARLRPESYALLRELATALNDPRAHDMRVNILGHTDSDGSADYNLALSLKRALAVKQSLTAYYGVAPDRLSVAGYGEGMPLRPNDCLANKQVNRRVEIVNTSAQ
ncbi:MAG: OmpA family protein [Desulfomicrobium sp.]